MATYEVTGPGGEVYQIDGPADADPSEVIAQLGGQSQPPSVQPEQPIDPSAGGGTLSIGPFNTGIKTPEVVDRALAGAGKAFVDLGRGAGQMLGLVDNEDVTASRERDAPLMATTAGKVGNIAGNIAATVPALAVPGANTVAGAGLIGAGLGALQPAESGKERLTNTAVGGVVGAAAQGIGGKIASWSQGKIAARTAQASTAQAQNAVRDATLKEARKVGYVVPPSTTNPTAANRIAESVSGKAATHQSAAVKNQVVTNRLVRQELGLPPDAPLTKKALNTIRSDEGMVYKALKSVGRITTDNDYLDDLAKLASSVDEVAKDFPELNVGASAEVNKLVDGLLKDSFDASSAVELVKQLRKDASANLSFAAAADPSKRALGTAQREAAGAVEDMLIRHLNSTGKSALAKRFDAARVRIAKTYSVEAALNEGTGNVVATNLATQLKKGKPLSGNFEKIARFAQAFPEAAREMKSSAGVSALDAATAVVGGSTLNPALFALPAARIGVREALLSKAGQAVSATPKYVPGKTGTALLRAGKNAKKAVLPSVAYATQQE
jgi:hypothetical protein